MGLLAVVQAEGSTPLAEMLLDGAARPRRGAVAVVVTPSLDQSWVRPLAALRAAGVSPMACIVDPLAHLDQSNASAGWQPTGVSEREPFERDLRALQHALSEHDVEWHVLRPGTPLGEQLVSSREVGARVSVA
jgi:hypothetical protein